MRIHLNSPLGPRAINLSGKRFGRLLVVGFAGRSMTPKGQTKVLWTCRCDCGKETIAMYQELVRGNKVSCRCFQRERQSEANRTHGGSQHRLFDCWANMLARCLKPKHPSWKYYGGRGITVCKRWLEFWSFVSDMSPTFKEVNGETHTITQWSKMTGINYGTIRNRIINGWELTEAITKPSQIKHA